MCSLFFLSGVSDAPRSLLLLVNDGDWETGVLRRGPDGADIFDEKIEGVQYCTGKGKIQVRVCSPGQPPAAAGRSNRYRVLQHGLPGRGERRRGDAKLVCDKKVGKRAIAPGGRTAALGQRGRGLRRRRREKGGGLVRDDPGCP